MNKDKKKALNVLKKWVEKNNKDLDLEMKVKDFVADWVLDDDSEPLIINGEGNYGDLLYNYYAESELYEFGVNKEFVDMLEKKGLYAENVNAAEVAVYPAF
jgi:hypothetical protein